MYMPQFQRRTVEADWTLLRTCNFRCKYCFLTQQMLGSKLQVFARNEDWCSAFSHYDVDWFINISGGEPLIYPRFAELAGGLTERNFISLNTNLSRPSISDFASQVKAHRVRFINAALHPGERNIRANLDPFLRRAKELMDCNFNIFVSVVITPEIAQDIRRFEELVADAGLPFYPKVMRGKYKDRSWPEAYTDEQRAAILRSMDRVQSTLSSVSKRGGPSLCQDFAYERKMLEDRRNATSLLSRYLRRWNGSNSEFYGKDCGAGISFVSIDPSGEVTRCSTKTSLGNLLDRSFQFLNEVRACDTFYCKYYCNRHTSRETLRSIEANGALEASQ